MKQDAVIFDGKDFEELTVLLQNLNDPIVYMPSIIDEIVKISFWDIKSLEELVKDNHFRTIDVRGVKDYIEVFEKPVETIYGRLQYNFIKYPPKIKKEEPKVEEIQIVEEEISPINFERFVISVGGIGDALLAIADAKQKDASIVFIATHPNTKIIVEKLISSFGIKVLVFEDRRKNYYIWKNQKSCVSTTHIPDNFDYLDWQNFEKYKNRIITELDVQNIFGKVAEGDAVAIAPAGSMNPKFIGEMEKQRFITKEDLMRIIDYSRYEKIYLVGGEKEINYYGIFDQENVKWLSFEGITDKNGFFSHEIKDCFKIINGCKLILSVDTWLKTYGHYAGIETIVFQSKYSGLYSSFAEFDTSEYIFLNDKVWNIKTLKIEEYLNEMERMGKNTKYDKS